MKIHRSNIFEQFPEIKFGLSQKQKLNANDKFSFNMSKSIGDNKNIVEKNRKTFFADLGFSLENVIIQKQTHSSIVNIVDKFENDLIGDALITKHKNLGLAISTADCTNIYLFDKKEKVIAAVHSGWEGTEKRILEKTLKKMSERFNCKPKNLFIYLAPSISQENYEVGPEFINRFNKKYLLPKNKKFLLDLKRANKDMLLSFGIPEDQIEISPICSFRNENFHSYRRDKNNSGRALGVIVLR